MVSPGSDRVHGKSEASKSRPGPNAARSADVTQRRSSYGQGSAAKA